MITYEEGVSVGASSIGNVWSLRFLVELINSRARIWCCFGCKIRHAV